jgi:transcriptional regulator with XRE-family HTH domain
MTGGDKLNESELWEDYYTNLHRAHQAMRAAFAKSGMTQDELAAKLGIDKGLVSKRLNGNDNLTLRTLSFMASAMGCRLVIEPLPYAEVASPSKSTAKKRTLRKAESAA